MTLFFTATLGFSIAGMAMLLGVKRYELSTGTMLFQSLRPSLNRVFHRSSLFVERHLPALVYAAAERVIRVLMRTVHRRVAEVLVFAEYWLQRTLDFLTLTTHVPHPTTPASAFLREVAEHKKNLLKRNMRPSLSRSRLAVGE